MARVHASRPAPPPEPATAEDRRELWDRIADLRVAMLATHDADGTLSARPVSTVRVDPGGVMWYFVAAGGGIARDLERNPSVHLCVMDIGKDVYAWLRGTAGLVDDRQKVRALWSTLAGAWFPGGPDDPDLGLLRVDVQRGDYWDVTSSKLVQFFTLATAAITRTAPSKETGRHKRFGR